MAESVAVICEQLIKAVNVMMDAESSQRYRLEALKFCEEFKEQCPFCVPCGLQLADKSQSPVVRHFGLQILEHVIKFRWNTMPQQEKVQLKNCAMGLLSNGTHFILEEESHIKDALSRIIVEMIKREWPQQWPDMLKELEDLSKLGESQTELVMLILLRLAEDVITFQTLPSQRRKDIQHTLTQNMDSILSFLLTILQLNVDEYRRLKSDPSQELKARAHSRVGVATLNTLAGYIDWVALVHITNEQCRLMEILCLLLSETELQLEAAECLLIAVSRKGKLEDRKPLMVLFNDVAMHYILSANCCGPEGCVGSHVEVEVPGNLNKFMEAFLAFTTHPSQFLRSSTQLTWGTLFRHEVLSKHPVIVEVTSKYMRATMTNLVKTGFPSKSDSPSCEYSLVDFDNDEDFNTFFNSFRAQQGEVVRIACKIIPLEAFQMAGEWLQYQVKSPIDVGPTMSKTAEGLCSILSPSVVQWDAMTFFMESIVGQLLKTLEKEKVPVDQGIELLQAMLSYETRDPLILSCVLTNVSSLFPFVTYRPHFLPQVLHKVRPLCPAPVLQCAAPRTRAVKNVRRHACSSIIKMCRDYPQFILPCFDMLYCHVKKLFSNELLLTQMEKCALMEALVLISNQFKDYEKQKAFLEELMAPVVVRWLSEEMGQTLLNPVSFLAFVGADQVMNDSNIEDQTGINRSRISFCVYTILGVVKRARWPADVEEAKAGGFLVGYTPSGNPIYRNPCAPQVLALLPNLLALIRTHNSLFLPEHMARLSETFARAYDVMDVEKNVVLGLPQPVLEIYDSPVYKTSLERMQGFFCTLYDNCFHILGHAGPSLNQDFYTIEGLAEQLVSSVLINLDHVPDHRLRAMLHILSQLVVSCPQEYYDSLLCPLLGHLFAYMLQVSKAQFTWEEEVCGEKQVTQEMLEEELLRLVTRELLDLLSESHHYRQEDMMATDSTQASTVTPTYPTDELTELGKCLIKHEDIYMTFLTISFNCLCWKDTSNCQRTASQVCWTLLKQIVGGNLLPEAVTWFYTSVLKGLQVHGQHEGCSAALTLLAFLIYEALRPRYSELRVVMTHIPNIQLEALDQFDQRLLNPATQKAGEKKRKEQFKKLIAGTVGKPLGQQFRKEVHIRNLPSLFKKVKPEVNRDILETSESPALVSLFSPLQDDI
uniref:Exportin 5 n=1 Tax=Scleropages formosus TaxID=113540 RepID=A0A8C9U474_SCLFO